MLPALLAPLCEESWWRHQMETFSALLAICAGNSPASGEFAAQRPVTRSFDVCFDLRLNNRLSKQSWGWWFETASCPLWRHCNATAGFTRHEASNVELFLFFLMMFLSKKSFRQVVDSPVIWDSLTLMWRHFNRKVNRYVIFCNMEVIDTPKGLEQNTFSNTYSW